LVSETRELLVVASITFDFGAGDGGMLLIHYLTRDGAGNSL
jgi:hypothetical protein